MEQLTVQLPSAAYPVYIGRGLLAQAGPLLREASPVLRWAMVADETAAGLYGAAVLDSLRSAGLDAALYPVPAGERAKTIPVYEDLCRRILRDGFDRTCGVVSLGGGACGDLAGFAAATLLRGVALAHLPTTLLSQADSAIGGKAGLDLPEGKNQLGAFWQPSLVLSDPACLATLPPRQLSSGMAEVIKCACIADAALLDELEESPRPDPEKLIAACCRVKAHCIAADERDDGPRRLLNFGHTFGHAYEALGGYAAYTHGEAVAAGMAQMLRWQIGHGLGGDFLLARLERLLPRYGLPAAIDCDRDALRRYLPRDKKASGARITVVVVERPGEGRLEEIPLESLWEDAL